MISNSSGTKQTHAIEGLQRIGQRHGELHRCRAVLGPQGDLGLVRRGPMHRIQDQVQIVESAQVLVGGEVRVAEGDDPGLSARARIAPADDERMVGRRVRVAIEAPAVALEHARVRLQPCVRTRIHDVLELVPSLAACVGESFVTRGSRSCGCRRDRGRRDGPSSSPR